MLISLIKYSIISHKVKVEYLNEKYRFLSRRLSHRLLLLLACATTTSARQKDTRFPPLLPEHECVVVIADEQHGDAVFGGVVAHLVVVVGVEFATCTLHVVPQTSPLLRCGCDNPNPKQRREEAEAAGGWQPYEAHCAAVIAALKLKVRAVGFLYAALGVLSATCLLEGKRRGFAISTEWVTPASGPRQSYAQADAVWLGHRREKLLRVGQS